MSANSVTVFQRGGMWIVAIVEGVKNNELEFASEEYARNYAAGQSKRLQATLEPEPSPPIDVNSHPPLALKPGG
ncbi:UNVERIFIED_ORG: hypothetical protein GGD48_004987 [Rhizobium etli]